MDKTEQYILEQFKQSAKKEEAFRLLVKTYQERLYYHIKRMVITHEDSDDVLQNTFIKVWRFLEDFKEDASLYTWLYRIATNEALQHLKKQKRSATSSLDDHQISDTGSETGLTGTEIEQKLKAAIEKLPEKQMLVFNLKYFDELKYEEIAEITGTSVGALKASYFHAVKKIEDFLKA